MYFVTDGVPYKAVYERSLSVCSVLNMASMKSLLLAVVILYNCRKISAVGKSQCAGLAT